MDKLTIKNDFFNSLKEKCGKNNTYDFVVLFSGGKDSSYLAHTLKEIGKPCLLTLRNGFEDENFTDYVKTTANQLGLDLYFYHPIVDYVSFYKEIITNPRYLEIDSSPLCLLCSWHKMAIGVDFAEKMKIPFVFHGATPEQFAKGDLETYDEIKLFEEIIFEDFRTQSFNLIKTFKSYNDNENIKSIYDKIFYKSQSVSLICPYMYMPYNIEDIKKTLQEKYGWQNPLKKLSNEKYISSGCELFSLCQLLEKIVEGYKTHESEQISNDFAKGIINPEAFDYYSKHFFNNDISELLKKNETIISRLNINEWINSYVLKYNQNSQILDFKNMSIENLEDSIDQYLK